MPDLENVYEGSVAYLTVSFFDKDGTAVAPNTAHFEVVDLTSGDVLVEATEVDEPEETVTITLTPTANAIVDPRHIVERRRVIVRANMGTPEATNSKFDYNVYNMIRTP